jgi:hypothetical protein
MSSELKIDSSSQIIKINSRSIVFKINQKTLSEKLKTEKEKNNLNKYILISECFINIENISANYVALRVRTTKKYYYNVEPTYSIIAPNTFEKIKILYYIKPGEEISSQGHKFRFEGIIIEQKEKNTKNIFGLFQQYIQKGIVVKGNAIIKTVNFIYDNNFIISSKSTRVSDSNKNKISNNDVHKRTSLKDIFNLKSQLEQEIKECDELRNAHKNLMRQLNEKGIDIDFYLNNNNSSLKDYFIQLKQIIIKIKNSKIYSGVIIALFLFSAYYGFYLTK